MKKMIDGRNLPCPQPLMLLKKAVDAGDSEIIEITVDNKAARENLVKYAKHVKIGITNIEEANGEIVLTINTKTMEGSMDNEEHPAPERITEKEQEPVPEESAKTIFIRTDTIGSANRELGLLLMRGFIYTLTELDRKPSTIIFMNDGVRLAVKESESIENIQILEKAGVKILVCGTCLDYLNLTAELEAGQISNMYDITEKFMHSPSVLTM
jgi:selenium metabolism protein YedF